MGKVVKNVRHWNHIMIDYLLRNKEGATAFLSQMEAENVTLCTTAINIFEIHYGTHKSKELEKNA